MGRRNFSRNGGAKLTGTCPGGWPAGKVILMEDILRLVILEAEESGKDEEATFEGVAAYLKVAESRVSLLARPLLIDRAVKKLKKRVNNHGRIREVLRTTERGRVTAEALRTWLMAQEVEIDGRTAPMRVFAEEAEPGTRLTALLRKARFVSDKPRNVRPRRKREP